MKYHILIASVLVLFSACKPTGNTDSEKTNSQSINRVSLEKISNIFCNKLALPAVKIFYRDEWSQTLGDLNVLRVN